MNFGRARVATLSYALALGQRPDLASPDCPGRSAGSCARAGGAIAAALEAFEAATRGAVEARRRDGIRCKGSIRDGLNGAVEPGFAVGSRFKGSIRDGLNGAVWAEVSAGGVSGIMG